MPDSLITELTHEGDPNRISGVVPKLANLIERDQNVEVAYLCTESADQIWKLPDEGAHFCGYRNIQMLWSALYAADHEGVRLGQSRPTVLDLQDMIEQAWDAGFNEHGRVATGGIRNTRKHVGTSEAEGLMLSLSIPCVGRAFDGKEAWKELFDSIETYFSSAAKQSNDGKVRMTGCMPVFLQRPKHSMTVVGFERTLSGKRRLLTFDPAWRPPGDMMKPTSTRPFRWKVAWTLRMYRKSQRYLKRFRAFEALEISGRPGRAQ